MSDIKSPQPSASEPSSASVPDVQPKRSRRHRRWLLAVLILLPLLACLGVWSLGLLGIDAAAQVNELSGLVHVQRKDELAWNPAQLNQLVWGKDWIRTGDSSSARLRFFDVSTADIGPTTEVMVEQVDRKRSGDSGRVTLQMWSGTVAVRAVRFMDPSSFFRVDTPTASTVVRGARFAVEIEPEGQTRVEVHEGSAEVQVGDETLSLGMGEQVMVGTEGQVERQRIAEPNPALIQERVRQAWSAPGDAYRLELPEGELNQYLAAVGTETGLPIENPQVWLTGDQARVYVTLTEPVKVELNAALDVQVVDGRLVPQIAVAAGGLPVSVPGPVLDLALQTVLGQLEGYIDQAYGYVEFSDVQIKDARILAVGRKQNTLDK